MERILILGAGAIGGSIAGYLARAGCDVTIADIWSQHVHRIQDDGLTIEAPDETFTAQMPALHTDELQRLPGPVDVLMISTKTYDTEWAYQLAAPYLADDGVVLSAQNGMVEEQLPRYADMERVVGCPVMFAGECMEAGTVIRRSPASWPVLALGELDGQPTARVDRLQALLAPVGEIQVTDDIIGKLWAKLAVNAMSNGTSALTLATTGMVWGDAAYVELTVALAAETARVAEAAGIAMQPVFARAPQDVLVRAYDGEREAIDASIAWFGEVAEQRKGERGNRPSMLQDILKGRRTEVDDINGYVCSRGRAVGVATPVNDHLRALVREVDRGHRKPGPTNLVDLQRAVPVA